MNCTVLHGDHLEAIEEFLTQAESVAHSKGTELVRVNLADLGIDEAERVLLQSGLFQDARSVMLSGVNTLRKKADLERFSALIKDSTADILIFHRAVLGKLVLDAIKNGRPTAKVIVKKMPKATFKWVEQFGVTEYPTQRKMYLDALKQESAEFVFAMLQRHARFLLEDALVGRSSAFPFAQRGVRQQAQAIGQNQVIQLYTLLAKIDLEQKTSRNRLPIIASLPILHNTARQLAKNSKKG